MCGIAGIITRSYAAEAARDIRAMADAIAHRGPDGEGFWSSEAQVTTPWRVFLAHRRLAIIDIGGGAQPMVSARSGDVIAFNGEIYNFRKLRADLETRGVSFKSRSDTEVLLEKVTDEGLKGLGALDGMFAFAHWSHSQQRLLIARDRAGIKPLYYLELPDGGMAFASELTSLLKFTKLPRRVDRSALAGYFFSDSVNAPRALIQGVRKLPPAHSLTWTPDGLQPGTPFWNVREALVKRQRDFSTETDERGQVDCAKKTREILTQAVRDQMVADVPVGVFLSGGIDSSTVAALAQRESNRKLQTFSIGFEDKTFDESAYARHVAKHIGSDHTEQVLSESILIDTAAQVIDRIDEPMADPSLVPTYLLSRLAAHSVKVALGGDGGDELWGGYPTYFAHRMLDRYKLIPAAIRETWIPKILSWLPVSDRYQSFEWKLKRFSLRADADPVRCHLRWMSNTDLPDLQEGVLQPNAPELTDAALGLVPDTSAFAGSLNQFLALDFQTYMPGSVLTKVDRASMAHSLEVRPPFLANASIAWAFGLPDSLKLKGSQGKWLLKQAVKGLLPEEIVFRKKKGFGIPLAKWIRGPLQGLVTTALEDSPVWSVLSQSTFKRWNEEHLAHQVDRSKPLWALVAFDRWRRRIGVDF